MNTKNTNMLDTLESNIDDNQVLSYLLHHVRGLRASSIMDADPVFAEIEAEDSSAVSY